MIPKENIDELLARASIVQVISEYLPLTKRGSNHVGLCPFHSEKTPSFSVSEAKRIFYCFGCNETGNVITFVMKKDGLSFPEAVRSLGVRYGVSIAEEKKAASGLRNSIYAVNAAASEYFMGELSAAGGASARGYLKHRGFEDAGFLATFKVGFAPDKWEGLSGYLKKKGVDMALGERAGVVVKKKNGYYDRFRSRLIFPIMDVRGRVIGFGGRALGDAVPKYLNSPESMVFKKGAVLFGLHQAREAIAGAGFAIVVEGYFDLLAMHRSGFTNTVATMGTAMTAEHIRVLRGYAKSIYTLFDTDEAGKKAAIRSLDLFLDQETPCRVVRIEGGKDPDEFLSGRGPGPMKEAIERAEPLMEFYLKELLKRSDLNSPEGKSRFFEEALKYLNKIKNVVETGHYAVMLATMLDISTDAVYGALRTSRAKGAKAGGKGGRPSGALKGLMATRSSNLRELTVLKVILRHPELFSPRVEEAVGRFRDEALKEAGRSISVCLKEGRTLDFAALVEGLADERLKGVIAGMLFKEDDGFIENPKKMLDDSLRKVLNRGKLKETTEHMIERLEASGKKEMAEKVRERAMRRPLNK